MSNNRPTVSIRGRRGMRFALNWRAAAAGPALPEVPPQPAQRHSGNLRARRLHDGCYRLFHVCAIPVNLHWSLLSVFAALVTATLWLGIGPALAALALWALMLVHELGHAAFARRLGYEVVEIRLLPLRGRCLHQPPYSAFEVAVIAWGGAAGQMLLLLPATAMLVFHGNTHSGALNVFLIVFSYVNATIVAVNLLPVRNLDGMNAWRLPLMLLRARWTMRSLRRSSSLF